MSLNDPMANVLSNINNFEKVGKKELLVGNNSKQIRKMLDLLKENGFVGSYEEEGKGLKINLLGNINNAGVIKPRFSVKKTDFEKWEKRYLPAKNFGVLIVSTSQGMMTHNQAEEKDIGGRLIAYCY